MNNFQYVKHSLLGALERVFKTDVRYLIRGGAWLGMSQFALSGTTFLLSIAFANLLSAEAYGAYKYILSVVSILAITTLSGMDNAVTRAVAQGYEQSVYEGLRAKFTYGMFGTAIGVLIATYYALNHNTTLSIGFAVAALALPFWESFDIYNSFLNGRKLFKTFATHYSITQLFTAALVFGTLITTKNILAILIVYFTANALLRIINFYFVTRRIILNNKSDRETMAYGKRLSGLNIIGTLVGQIDQILIFHYIGARDLVVYALAIAPVENLKGMLKNIQALALPRFAGRKEGDVREKIFDKALRLGVVTALLALCYVFIAPFFYQVFFPRYIDATLYSQIVAISLIAVSMQMFLNTFFESQGEVRALLQSNVFGLLNLLILFPLIYYFGVMGAITGRILGRFLSLAIAIALVKKISS